MYRSTASPVSLSSSPGSSLAKPPRSMARRVTCSRTKCRKDPTREASKPAGTRSFARRPYSMK